MQSELQTSFPELAIDILGVNDRGSGSVVGNGPMTEGRDIPWLQDVDDAVDGQAVWEAWSVTERDVIILDKNNVLAGRYNLTANDLGEPEQYQELKDLFVEIASSQTEPSSLSGEVYVDQNSNGQRDPAELPLSNVQITLTGVDELGNPVRQTVRTEASGGYAFFGLAPGSYTIAQTQPTFLVDGRDTLGSAGGTVGSDQFTVTLQEGVDGQGYSFGELGRQARTVSMTDFLASTPSDGMITAAEVGTGDHWYCLAGEWQEYQYANVELSQDGSTVTVNARDTHGHDFQNVFDVFADRQVDLLGTTVTHKSLRIAGELTDITASSASSAVEQATGDTDGQSGAEGESPSMNWVATRSFEDPAEIPSFFGPHAMRDAVAIPAAVTQSTNVPSGPGWTIPSARATAGPASRQRLFVPEQGPALLDDSAAVDELMADPRWLAL